MLSVILNQLVTVSLQPHRQTWKIRASRERNLSERRASDDHRIIWMIVGRLSWWSSLVCVSPPRAERHGCFMFPLVGLVADIGDGIGVCSPDPVLSIIFFFFERIPSWLAKGKDGDVELGFVPRLMRPEVLKGASF